MVHASARTAKHGQTNVSGKNAFIPGLDGPELFALHVMENELTM